VEVTASQWAYNKWKEAIVSGDEEAAANYMQIYKYWESKGK